MSKDNFQNFLDEVQYTLNGVKRYEWIFGETWLSSGGAQTTDVVLSRIQITPGSRVLDMGSGIGGHSFHLAEKFNCKVLGIDLSRNMVAVAEDHLNRRPHLQKLVEFELRDATKLSDLEENSFDVIYSRDTLLHIEDKANLFSNFFKWLKPGGQIIFTEYGRGDKSDYTAEFKAYVAQRQYHLLTVQEYEKVLQAAGFQDIEAEDWTLAWKDSLQRELKKLTTQKEDFLSQFSQKDYDDLFNGWTAKLKRVEDGDQAWIFGYARKAA
jgi:phosphoethanolamine N-methyltransferase